MAQIKDIYGFLDSFAPFSAQCSWDNSGFLTGDINSTVTKIVVALDITKDVVAFAADIGAQLIVSHHPVIFSPKKQVLSDDVTYMLIKSGIGAICAHTSLDIAKGGVNDALAYALGFTNVVALTEADEASMVRVYELHEEKEVQALAEYVSEKLGGAVRFSDSGKKIRKIALCGGAGCDFIEEVSAAGCDLYITGDVSHHNFLYALQLGLSVIGAGHYETENPVVKVIADKIKAEFNDVEVIAAPTSSPCKTINI